MEGTAEAGEMGVLPGHDVMIVQLGMGLLSVNYPDRRDLFFVCRGYTEIEKDHVRVIAEISETRDKIDVERAQQARERAEHRLKEGAENIDWFRAETALKRATYRLDIAKMS